jgi:hypothetical protein
MTCRHRLEHRRARRVTDGAVVVTLRRMCEPQQRDHILVFVVRKLDRELKFESRVSKRKPRFVAWRRLCVTHGADRRPRAPEKLPPVTTHTCIVARVIIDVRKGYLVTRITRSPVFLRRMRKIRRGYTRIDADQAEEN